MGKRTKLADLPQCPIPIFFVFRLDEVLNKYKGNCFVSNGNLRHYPTTSIGNTIEFLKKFDYKNLYSSINDCDTKTFLNASQQEFVIKDEFNFSDIHGIRIVCHDNYAKNTLIKLIGFNNKYCQNIIVDNSYYYYSNPHIQIDEKDSLLEFNIKGNIEAKSKLKAIFTTKLNSSKEFKVELITSSTFLTISNN